MPGQRRNRYSDDLDDRYVFNRANQPACFVSPNKRIERKEKRSWSSKNRSLLRERTEQGVSNFIVVFRGTIDGQHHLDTPESGDGS
jgi:hypothetical protein